MRDRPAIRGVVWGEGSYEERVDRLSQTIGDFEFLDLQNQDHLIHIDQRLNQNYLVGAAVQYLDWTKLGEFQHGQTIWHAVIALVPRAIWPDKPVVAGSMNLVADHTGLAFADTTSIGVGHVLEFYLNFGTLGVMVGFFVLGTVVGVVDRRAAFYLTRDDWLGFTRWFLPGLSLLNVGGSLVELTSSAGAAVLIAWFVQWIFARPSSLHAGSLPMGSSPRTQAGQSRRPLSSV
jgi:hypothetical protein